VLKEMSERFEGIKIKRSQPSAAPTDCVSSGVGTVPGGDAERHGMHSHAGAWERSGRRDLVVIGVKKIRIFF
jgi:hypothetical protein